MISKVNAFLLYIIIVLSCVIAGYTIILVHDLSIIDDREIELGKAFQSFITEKSAYGECQATLRETKARLELVTGSCIDKTSANLKFLIRGQEK